MDIKIVSPVTGKEEVNTSVEVKEPESTPIVMGEMVIQSVGNMFDLKPSEIGLFRDKIGTLIDYAKSQTEDHSKEGILWAIRSLQGKVGTPPLGEKMINFLNKYAWIKLEQISLDKEAKRYEKNI